MVVCKHGFPLDTLKIHTVAVGCASKGKEKLGEGRLKVTRRMRSDARPVVARYEVWGSRGPSLNLPQAARRADSDGLSLLPSSPLSPINPPSCG